MEHTANKIANAILSTRREKNPKESYQSTVYGRPLYPLSAVAATAKLLGSEDNKRMPRESEEHAVPKGPTRGACDVD